MPTIRPRDYEARGGVETALANMTPAERAVHTVYIYEVGYCRDFNHDGKLAETLEQHTALVTALQTEGWQIKYDHETIITLGTAGTIPRSLSASLLHMEVSHTQRKRCAEALHQLAINYISIIAKRRELEKTAKTHTPPARRRQGQC
jgi:hypothetical protein